MKEKIDQNFQLDMKMKKKYKLIFALLIPFIFFSLIFLLIPINEIMAALFSADLQLIILSIIPLLVSISIAIFRWKYILQIMGYSLSLKKILMVYMAALPLTSVTPSKSGDLIRAYYLKDIIPITKTVVSVITEHFFDFLVLVFFCYMGMILTDNYEYCFIISLFFAILLCFFVVAQKFGSFSNNKYFQKIFKLLSGFDSLNKKRESYFVLFFFSIIIWSCAIIQCIILFASLSIYIPLDKLLAGIPIGIFVGMLPVSLGGMGTRDAAFIYIFSDYSSVGNLVIFGILFTFLRYWFISLMGIPFMMMINKIESNQTQ